MAIQFVVEDGSGKSDATSYASVEAMKQYWTDWGYSYAALTDDQIKVLLNRATQVLDGQYYALWPGERSLSTQALQWPRANAWYPDGHDCPSSVVPDEIERATCEMAYAKSGGTDLQPISTNEGDLLSEAVRVGPISEDKSYAPGSQRAHPRIPAVDDALRPLLGRTGTYGAMGVIRV